MAPKSTGFTRATCCYGRDSELSDLVGRLTATVIGGAELMLVTGAPGIGKTTVIRECAQRVSADLDAQVLTARAMSWESDTPGAVLQQLFGISAATEVDDLPGRLVQLIAAGSAQATGPILIGIDDAEYADPLSLQALVSLTRRHRSTTVLIVLTASSISPRLAELGADTYQLHGLPANAIAELAAEHGCVLHPAVPELLTAHTAGNPRDALALITALPASVWSHPTPTLPAPAHIVAKIKSTLEHSSAEGRALIESLAVLGSGPTLGDTARLAGLADPLDALDDARNTGLLSPHFEDHPQLATNMITAAVIELMGVRRTADAHRRAAEIVHEPVRRLRHLVAATPVVDAALADEVDRIASERGNEGAWSDAASLFRDASRLSVDPALRDERLIRCVDALVATGDCVGAAALAPAVESLRETPLRSAVLAYLAIIRGRATEADSRLRRAWALVDPKRQPEVAAMVAQRYVLHALCRGDGQELTGWADRAISLVGEENGVEAVAIRGLGFAISGQLPQAQTAYAQALRVVEHGPQAGRVALGRGWLSVLADQPDEARSRLGAVVSADILGGSSRISLWALGWLSRVHLQTGEWDEALRVITQGRRLAAATGIALATPLMEWTATVILTARGAWEDAAIAARAAGDGGGYEIMQIPALLARAQLAAAKNDHGRICRLLEPLTHKECGAIGGEPSWPWVEVLANALTAEGRFDAADRLLRPHEDLAVKHDLRSARARLGYARARLLGARGDVPRAGEVFENSLELLHGLPLSYDRARITFGYGQTLRRAGRRRDAEAKLSTARDLWDGLGATIYVDLCDRELKAGGSRTVRNLGVTEALTQQEETVAELVASGLANREVAAQLFVSAKTVQYHLTRIYAKLGVRSRTELAVRYGDRSGPHSGQGVR